MSADTPRAPPQATPPSTLANALDQSEQVKNIVEECAEDLSTVNTALNQELAATVATPRVALAVAKSAGVEDKVNDASAKLAVVNEALKVEVKERHVLENRLRALTEQSEADRHAAFHDPLTGLPSGRYSMTGWTKDLHKRAATAG